MRMLIINFPFLEISYPKYIFSATLIIFIFPQIKIKVFILFRNFLSALSQYAFHLLKFRNLNYLIFRRIEFFILVLCFSLGINRIL